jgi:hypothetical protein
MLVARAGRRTGAGQNSPKKPGFFVGAFPEMPPFLAKSGALSLSTRQKPGFFQWSRVTFLV